MARIALTKNELKKQRDSLKLFRRYLPTLQLKKQQLQAVVRRIAESVATLEQRLAEELSSVEPWIAVFGEEVDLGKPVGVPRIHTEHSSVAGIEIPVFRNIDFEAPGYDLFSTPLWVDGAIDIVRSLTSKNVEIAILREQMRLLAQELAITTQRVNLFEKVKIPEAQENIRRIQISLGDQQTAAVVRGKISKRKIAAEKQEAAARPNV